MKNYLLLLLIIFSIATQAQTYQNPTFGKLTLKTNTTSTTATKVNVQESNGEINSIAKADLIEVLEYASAINLPVTGLAGKIYVTIDNNRMYRWNGAIYTELTTDITGKEDKSNKISAITGYSETLYPNEKATHDGLDAKLNISDLPSNLTLYATNVPSGVSTYTKWVTTLNDPDYNTTAVDISTGAISGTTQLISGLSSIGGVIIGNPGIMNVTTVGNIRRTAGTGTAKFYFELYKRTSAGVESFLGVSDFTMPVDFNTYSEFSATAVWNDGVFTDTDRIVIKFYGSRIAGGSDPTFDFQFGGLSPVRTIVPVPFRVVAGEYELKANKVSTLSASDILYPNNNAVIAGLATKQNTLTNPVTGTGTSGIVPVFTGTSTLGNSAIQANSTTVGIGTNPIVSAKLTVDGSATFYGIDITSSSAGSLFRDPAGYLQLGSNQLKYVGEGGYIINAQGTTVPIVLSQNSAEKARISTGGRFVVGGGSDNGIDGGQFGTGTVSGGNASLSNQFVTKSQLDLKANIGATLNTTGDQTFTGFKTGISSNATPAGFDLTNNNTNAGSTVVLLTNSPTSSDNGSSAIRVLNNNAGNFTSAIQLINDSTGLGGFFKNLSTGNGLFFENWSTGVGSVYNSLTASTGDLIRFEKQGTLTGKVNSNGEITAPKLTMTGTIELKSYTVATLPTGVQGMFAYVTDALAPTYMATVVGGGAVVTPVFYNGTNWVAH